MKPDAHCAQFGLAPGEPINEPEKLLYPRPAPPLPPITEAGIFDDVVSLQVPT